MNENQLLNDLELAYQRVRTSTSTSPINSKGGARMIKSLVLLSDAISRQKHPERIVHDWRDHHRKHKIPEKYLSIGKYGEFIVTDHDEVRVFKTLPEAMDYMYGVMRTEEKA